MAGEHSHEQRCTGGWNAECKREMDLFDEVMSCVGCDVHLHGLGFLGRRLGAGYGFGHEADEWAWCPRGRGF